MSSSHKLMLMTISVTMSLGWKSTTYLPWQDGLSGHTWQCGQRHMPKNTRRLSHMGICHRPVMKWPNWFCLGEHERGTVVILRKHVTVTSLLFCCSLSNCIYLLLLLLTQYSLLYLIRLQTSGHDLNVKVSTRRERSKWRHTCVVVCKWRCCGNKSWRFWTWEYVFVSLTNVHSLSREGTIYNMTNDTAWRATCLHIVR